MIDISVQVICDLSVTEMTLSLVQTKREMLQAPSPGRVLPS